MPLTGYARLLGVVCLALHLVACQESRPVAAVESSPPAEVQVIRAATLDGLESIFQALEYDWQKIDAGVPPLVLKHFPENIDEGTQVNRKKRAFFMGLLPMVLLANQQIREERRTYLEILQRFDEGEPLSESDRQQLDRLAKRYGLRRSPITDHRTRTRLLMRIDTLPPALVLAQAANESAWGSSRFARLGNNLFGQWTFKPGTGIVPRDRPDGATYEVARYSSLFESIRSYMDNLNTNGAYRRLREIRHRLRKAGKSIQGTELAEGLLSYSIRREAYVDEIQEMIAHNQLTRLNRAELRSAANEELLSHRATGSGLFSSRSLIIGDATASTQQP